MDEYKYLKPIRYQYADSPIYVETRGNERWVAVNDMRMVLNHDLEWEFEKSPSNRDDDFIARTRYPSVQEALDQLNRLFKMS